MFKFNKKKFLNFITFFTIFLFVCLLAFIFYRSEIYSGFSRFYYYKKYYLITSILIVFFSFSFFYPEKIRILNFISLFIISVTIYSFEIYLYNLGKPKYDMYKEYEKRLKKNVDWVVPFPPKYILTYHTEFFSGKNYLPLSGISNRNTLHCNENDYWAIFKSDRYGLNNNDDVWDSKINATLLGDSYTMGACVNSDENISGHLKKLNINTLNLGYGGNGPLIELATLIEYIPIVKTNKILWLYSNNDLDDLNVEKTSSLLTNYLEKNLSLNIYKNQTEIDKIYLNYLSTYERQSNYMSIIKLERARKKLNSILKKEDEKNVRLNYDLLINKDLKKILLIAKNISEKNDQEFYFVYVPGRENFYPNSVSHSKVKELKPKILAMVKELNIEIIDLEEYLKNEKHSEMFPKRGHYNSKGYQLLAEGIFNNIK